MPGVVSRSVLSTDASLILGDVVLADVGIDVHDPARRARYTLDAIGAALADVDSTPCSSFATGFDQFVSYLVLDALIGNTDRHEENWGVVEAAAGSRCLAPSFDHASSFGFQLSDAQRDAHLDGTAIDVAKWARRGRTKFVDKPHPCTVAVAGLSRLRPERARHLLEQLAAVDLVTEAEQLPSSRWSPTARAFALAVAAANRDRLLS